MIPITITTSAASEIRDIFKHKNIPSDYALRVGVKGNSGCAGVNYLIGFDLPKDNDHEYLIDDIRVIIARKDFMFLIGIELDFVASSQERGFVFNKESSEQINN